MKGTPQTNQGSDNNEHRTACIDNKLYLIVAQSVRTSHLKVPLFVKEDKCFNGGQRASYTKL